MNASGLPSVGPRAQAPGMAQLRALVTNDDGIDSFFLSALVEALKERFAVTVAAPLGEKSWIGRALTRQGEVHVSEYEHHGCRAWALDGTPTDCVNIALGHLLTEAEHPHVVVSGINLGYNASMPYILSSGTIAGALEGVFWGIPALAASQKIPRENFEEIRRTHGKVSGPMAESLHWAARHTAQWAEKAAQQQPEPLQVHNLNFPEQTRADTPVAYSQPGFVRTRSLFRQDSEATYRFQYSEGELLTHGPDTDRAVLAQGKISYGVLDFSRLAVHPATGSGFAQSETKENPHRSPDGFNNIETNEQE